MSGSLPRVWCATLGCDKNLVDSEALRGHFLARGCELADDPTDAEIWILNSCGFIAAARADSRAALQDLVARKGTGQFLAVCGCWSQEHGESIGRDFPGVDLVAGVGEFPELVDAILAGRREPLVCAPERARYTGLRDRPLLTPAHVAFVKISEGCDAHCTFCRIPSIRGRMRSRSPEDIVAEVRQLVRRGVREIQIISQNTGAYGHDRGTNLLFLVEQLGAITDLRWIRILYLYAGLLPAKTVLELLAVPKVVPYLDMPIQHASPRLLRAMRRPGNTEAMARYFAILRSEYPELVLRSTVLLGFPGEEEQDVEQLADFMARVEFDHLGTYHYSPEAGTPAAALRGRVSAEEVADREALILDLQAELALRRQQRRLGREFEVVIDKITPADEVRDLLLAMQDGAWSRKGERDACAKVLQSGSRVALARSFHFGYDLDGCVGLLAGAGCPGERLRARFLGVTPFDVWAERSSGDVP